MSALCQKAKCAPLIATIESTLLGSSDAALALAENSEYGAEDNEFTSLDLSNATSQLGADGQIVEEGVDNAAVLRFVNEWLGTVADATVGLLLAQIASIPLLTTVGSAQLITDLEYLR